MARKEIFVLENTCKGSFQAVKVIDDDAALCKRYITRYKEINNFTTDLEKFNLYTELLKYSPAKHDDLWKLSHGKSTVIDKSFINSYIYPTEEYPKYNAHGKLKVKKKKPVNKQSQAELQKEYDDLKNKTDGKGHLLDIFSKMITTQESNKPIMEDYVKNIPVNIVKITPRKAKKKESLPLIVDPQTTQVGGEFAQVGSPEVDLNETSNSDRIIGKHERTILPEEEDDEDEVKPKRRKLKKPTINYNSLYCCCEDVKIDKPKKRKFSKKELKEMLKKPFKKHFALQCCLVEDGIRCPNFTHVKKPSYMFEKCGRAEMMNGASYWICKTHYNSDVLYAKDSTFVLPDLQNEQTLLDGVI